MTTSLVGALLLHLGAVGGSSSSSSERQLSQADLALVHNTAQLAHCAAQGKVGSGFDVSSAVWGSHLYRRFDPLALQPLLDAGEKVGVEGGETVSDSRECNAACADASDSPRAHHQRCCHISRPPTRCGIRVR
jgi:phosphomevalonate kinase